jgi:hypothetical protein
MGVMRVMRVRRVILLRILVLTTLHLQALPSTAAPT